MAGSLKKHGWGTVSSRSRFRGAGLLPAKSMHIPSFSLSSPVVASDMNARESAAVKKLLSHSSAPYMRVLAGLEQDGEGGKEVSGWRNVRPTAVYDLRKGRQQRGGGGHRPHHHHHKERRSSAVQKVSLAMPGGDLEGHSPDYMSGELDSSFNYHYNKRGSSRLRKRDKEPHLPPPPPPTSSCQQHPRLHSYTTLGLQDPLYSYHSPYHIDEPPPDSRSELAKILALQLKPELLVEQIIIENRLRTMNVGGGGSLHHLNLEGVGVDPKSIHELDRGAWLQAVKSSSMPALPGMRTQQNRKPSKRKTRRRQAVPMDWCGVLNHNGGPHQVGGGAHQLGGGADMGAEELEGEEGEGRHVDSSLLQVRAPLPLQEGARYRLPQLHSHSTSIAASTSQLKSKCTRSHHHSISQAEYESMSSPTGAGAGGRSLQIPIVAPSLRTEGQGEEVGGGGGVAGQLGGEYWQQNKIKFVNKLRSLGW